jgi:hypothetical protein
MPNNAEVPTFANAKYTLLSEPRSCMVCWYANVSGRGDGSLVVVIGIGSDASSKKVR